MIGSAFPSDRCIADCLSNRYNIEAVSITPLSEGADMNAAIYKVHARDQASYFIKLKRGHDSDSNVALVELLHDNGIPQIITPTKTIDGHSIVFIDDTYLLVYPFIEGVNGFRHKLTDAQWIMLGKALRQVHDFDVPSSLSEHIRSERKSSGRKVERQDGRLAEAYYLQPILYTGIISIIVVS